MTAAADIVSNESVGPTVKLVALTVVGFIIVGVLLGFAWKHR